MFNEALLQVADVASFPFDLFESEDQESIICI